MYSFYQLENFSLAFDNNENHPLKIQITLSFEDGDGFSAHRIIFAAF